MYDELTPVDIKKMQASPAQILTADVALAVAFTAREEEAAILLRAVCFR